jgi:hypothetical protein
LAGALRPVVVLMALATVLFVVDGLLDGAYPGGDGWIGGPAHYGLGVIAYVFAIVNAGIALVIARGSERTLMGRIGLSAFFMLERPITAFALGPKPTASIAVHLATALVELVILLGALRVWRLGRSIEGSEMDAAFALDAPSPAHPGESEEAVPVAGRPPRTSWSIGLLTLLLSVVLVADGVAGGFIPGGKQLDTVGDAAGWLVYLYAVVVLTVAVPAVHGGSIALRVLFALALIFFVERAFSPFALRSFEPISLALHVLAAFVALALALVTAGAIRARAGRHGPLTTASTGGA